MAQSNKLHFVQKLYITIKVMDFSSKNIVDGNLYVRSTVFSTVLQIFFVLIYRSNIGSTVTLCGPKYIGSRPMPLTLPNSFSSLKFNTL